MNVRKTNKRKAISPVLATVILIAITLVAGVAIAGFAFGLFGSLSATANVQESVVGCVHGAAGNAAGDAYCEVELYNTGSAAASATSCSIYGTPGVEGTTIPPTAPGSISIGAGTAAPGTAVYCASAIAITAGTSVTGQIGMSNGISLTFTTVAS